MRLYKSDGKVFVELNETIELCKYDYFDTLQKYKAKLLESVSDSFDYTVAKAALKGMKED